MKPEVFLRAAELIDCVHPAFGCCLALARSGGYYGPLCMMDGSRRHIIDFFEAWLKPPHDAFYPKKVPAYYMAWTFDEPTKELHLAGSDEQIVNRRVIALLLCYEIAKDQARKRRTKK